MRSLSLALLAGCSLDISTSVIAGGRVCPPSGCPDNSPVIDLRWFHEAHERGRTNDAGLFVAGFSIHGHAYDLDVAGGRLHARRGATTITGDDLIDAEIRLDSDDGMKYVLRIVAVERAPYWAKNAGGLHVETYQMEWAFAADDGAPVNWQTLCRNPPTDDSDSLGMAPMHVVLFEGDRIEAAAKTVYGVDRSGEWFNIGCTGNALAKLALSGHTEAAISDGFVTSLDERQALLKMLSADYCGDGTPFTVTGQPLVWRDDRGMLEYATAPAKLEARWTSAGASCLETPRVMATPIAAGMAAFPDIEKAISAQCSRPKRCSEVDPQIFVGGEHLISAHP